MIKINLLPVREERRRAGLRQLAVLAAVALVASVGIVSVFHWHLRSTIASTKAGVQATQREIDRYGPELKQVQEYRKVKADIEKKLEVIAQLSDARSGPVHIFDELAKHVPERVWLTKMSIRNGKIDLQGMSLDNELVALFLTALGDSPYFKNVELSRTEAKTVNGFKLNAFDVTAQLTSPAAEQRAREAAEQQKTAGGPQDGALAAGR